MISNIGMMPDVNGERPCCKVPYQTDIVIKKSGKILYEDFFPHGAILLKQSRHIRHDEVESKNRNEEQQFYSEYQKIMCPSCGAEISLNSNEVHCPYCGGYIKSDFFDWQIEELLIYQDLNPNDYNYKMVAATLLVFFLPAVPCFRFIQSVEIILAVPFVLTVILAVILGAVLLRSKNSTEGLEEQIVRYDEKVLLVDLNEALNDAELTSDLLFYSVDKLQLKAVDNTEPQTTITIQAILHKLILQNNQKIIKKDKKMELKLYRARHPRRMKSKGQAVFSEKNVQAAVLISCRIKMVVVPTVDTSLLLIIQNGDLLIFSE